MIIEVKRLKKMKRIIENIRNKSSILFCSYIIIYLCLIPLVVEPLPENIMPLAHLILSMMFCFIYIYLNIDEFKNMMKKFLYVCDKSMMIGLMSIIILLISLTIGYIKMEIGINDNAGYTALINHYLKYPMIYTIYIVVVTPIVEELTFKVVLFKKGHLLNKNKKFKIVVISIIFASFHVLAELLAFDVKVILDFINYFLFSLITFNAYSKTENILVSIVIHMICNGVALFI